MMMIMTCSPPAWVPCPPGSRGCTQPVSTRPPPCRGPAAGRARDHTGHWGSYPPGCPSHTTCSLLTTWKESAVTLVLSQDLSNNCAKLWGNFEKQLCTLKLLVTIVDGEHQNFEKQLCTAKIWETIVHTKTLRTNCALKNLFWPERHLCRLGLGGLDHLCLVQADPPPLYRGEGTGHGHVPLLLLLSLFFFKFLLFLLCTAWGSWTSCPQCCCCGAGPHSWSLPPAPHRLWSQCHNSLQNSALEKLQKICLSDQKKIWRREKLA